MNPAAVLSLRARFGSAPIRRSVANIRRQPGNATVLVATVDPDVREGLSELLEAAPVNAIWVASVSDVKSIVSREKIAACLCGFWLQDGTYREVINYLRRKSLDIPTIILSTPACPQEYREYLTAVNIGALDFLSYPYTRPEFDAMLAAALGQDLEASAPSVAEAPYRERGAA